MWSDGVKQTKDEELEDVDKAVISGTQRVSLLSINFTLSVKEILNEHFCQEIECFLLLVYFSFVNIAKDWVQPYNAM